MYGPNVIFSEAVTDKRTLSTVWISVTHRTSINNLPDESRSSAGRTTHEGHGNRNGTDKVIRTDSGSNQSHFLCPILLLLFITEIILFSSLLGFVGFSPFTGRRFSALYSPLWIPSFLYRFHLFSHRSTRITFTWMTVFLLFFFFIIAAIIK